MFETNENIKHLGRQIKSLSKETDVRNKSHVDILDVKTHRNKNFKNLIDGLKSRVEGIEQSIRNHKSRTIEITQREKQNRLGEKKDRALGTCGTITKDLKTYATDYR